MNSLRLHLKLQRKLKDQSSSQTISKTNDFFPIILKYFQHTLHIGIKITNINHYECLYIKFYRREYSQYSKYQTRIFMENILKCVEYNRENNLKNLKYKLNLLQMQSINKMFFDSCLNIFSYLFYQFENKYTGNISFSLKYCISRTTRLNN